jgi:hypothetical protein
MGKKLLEVLFLFSSLFMIALLLIILFYSLAFWTANYPRILGLKEQAFYIAVGIAIVTSISQWLEGRIKAVIKSINILAKKGGVNGKRQDTPVTNGRRRKPVASLTSDK